MSETFTKWDAADHLRTPEDIRLYLEACADEDPGDGSLLRAALHDIARAGNMSRLARETGMSRKGLYKALSEDGNPTLATVMRITRALGMKVRITCRSQNLIGQRYRVGLAGVGQVAAVAGHAARSILSRATWAVSRKVAIGVFP